MSMILFPSTNSIPTPTSPTPTPYWSTLPRARSESSAADSPPSARPANTLLRTRPNSIGYADRYYSIFTIRHTRAASIAETLKDLFRAGLRTSTTSDRWPRGTGGADGDRRRGSRVVIVPDERLNTILETR